MQRAQIMLAQEILHKGPFSKQKYTYAEQSNGHINTPSLMYKWSPSFSVRVLF